MAKPKLTNTDFCRAAKKLNCGVAEIKAIAEQESAGDGFDKLDRPTILFEHAHFRRYTKGFYDESHPDISRPGQKPYGPTSKQWGRFNIAYALNPSAAMMSTSWGKFQVMGFNYKVCGFKSVVELFDAMNESESEHLNAFVNFVINNKLDDNLRNHDWAGFAKGYNGAGYRKNQYDTKIAAAYAKFAKEKIDCSKSSAAANQQMPATPPPDPTDKPVTDNQTPTPPILIDKEKISTFTKLLTTAKTAIGGAISAVGVWIGADDVRAILTKKADLLDMESFILIFGVMFKLAIVVGAGVFVVWLASSGYDKARQAVLSINTTKLENAANPETNTVEFKK